ncbi:hypothetical protein [Cellulomonas hominis]
MSPADAGVLVGLDVGGTKTHLRVVGIAVATTADGGMARAGGWGWVLSDDGSASALVREAARAVLAQADRGAEPEELGRLLLASVGVDSVAGLAHALSWDPGVETWGTHARAVTTAAVRAAARRRRGDGPGRTGRAARGAARARRRGAREEGGRRGLRPG